MKKAICVAAISLVLVALTGCGNVVIHDLKGEEIVTVETDKKELDNSKEVADSQESVEENISVDDKVLYFTDAEDGEGNLIPDSSQLFGEHDVTMVNVWATFCGPCIQEMPELKELAYELEQDNIGLVGICCDVMDYEGGLDASQLQLAKDIIADTGVEYTNVMLKDISDLEKVVNIDAVPTTFFVDKKGAVIGSTQIGAVDNEKYTELAHEALAIATGRK